MDNLETTTSNVTDTGGVADQLRAILYPATKDQVMAHLEGTEDVPIQILDSIRNTDDGWFDSYEDLRAKVGL